MRTSGQTRGGSALVIVLGFLSILILLVFAFAVRMQTEYRIARTADANVRTEFVMVQGIHLTALEVGHPVRFPAPSYWFYPRREFVSSSGVMVGDMSRGAIYNLLAAPADRFVPLGVFDAAIDAARTNYMGILPQRFGSSMPDPLNDLVAPPWSNVIVAADYEPSGLAYMVMNGSGYLDVHTPYQTSTRKYGRSVREIQLTDVITGTFTPAGNTPAGRIESTAELYAYRNSLGLAADNDLSLFCPYSYAIQGQYWDTNNGTLVSAVAITGTVASLTANQTEILNAFERAGFDQPLTFNGSTFSAQEVRGWLLTNLLNYADADNDPRGYDQPCQETVAGISEIAVATRYSCSQPNAGVFVYTLSVEATLELWRPHVTPTPLPQNYIVTFPRLLCSVTQLSGPGFALARNMAPVAQTGTVMSRKPVAMAPPVSISAAAVTTATYTRQLVSTLTLPALTLYFTPTAGFMVDKVAGPITITVTNDLGAAGPSVGETTTRVDYASIEFIDPRFNWNVTDTALWRGNTNSLGDTNLATFAYITNTINDVDMIPGDDTNRSTYAFCADRLPFETVGELGYLAVAPWRTVRLTKGPGTTRPVERVVDTFTLDPPGIHVRGLVNPNTCFTGVLQAVFNQALVDLYPGDLVISNVTAAQALQLATNIVAHTYLTNSTPGAILSPYGLRRGLLNRSELGDISTVFANTNLMQNMALDCDMLRESLIRNSVGLFSARNLSYTAVLCASDELDGGGNSDFPIRNSSRMAAEHKAVAMVWRDPWTKETFIRHFRYLPNDGILSQY